MRTTGVNEMLNKFGDTFDKMEKNMDDMFKEHDNRMSYMNAIFEKQSKPHFEIVSFDQFAKDIIKAFSEYDDDDTSIDEIKSMYNEIQFPTRSTRHSAGYDFRSPFYFYLNPGESIMIPTGIRAYMPSDMVLMIYPRSGLGTKYRLVPSNLTPIIDSDFYCSDNEGHIHLKMVNDGDKRVAIDAGKAFAQGVFMKYFTVDDDNASNIRNGGFGSSGM